MEKDFALVNKTHNQPWVILAKSGNLSVHIGDELVRLSDWLKGRADMPDSVEEVFDTKTEEWAENIQYLTTRETLICQFDNKLWQVYEKDGEPWATLTDLPIEMCQLGQR